MITVYFDGVEFSQRTFDVEKAEISAIGQREILTIRNCADVAIAQFDMNCVVGWTNDVYDNTAEEEEEE